MRYLARAIDPAVLRVQDLECEAASEVDARRWIESQGLAALSVRPDRRFLSAFTRRKFNVPLFLQELSTLMGAGMTVVEAVDTLIAKSANPQDAIILRALMLRLQEGRSLSDAMSTSGGGLPSILIAAVRANETSGQVNQALRDYLKYDGMVRGLQRKIVSAALYPSLVVGFGFLVSLFLLGYVVPRFAGLYGDQLNSVSVPTLVLLRLAAFIRDYEVASLLIALLLLGAAVYLVGSGKAWRAMRPFALRVPHIKRGLRTFALARLNRGLEFLVRGGYPISEALPLAAQLAEEGGLGPSFETARSFVNQGMRFSEAMKLSGLTDVVSERLLAVGERSGQMAQTFASLGDIYATEMEQNVERLSRIVEPLLLILVGSMVGGIVLLMYMPVFDLGGSL